MAAKTGVQTPDTDGTWYDIAEGRSETLDLETLDESGAWRGLQWLNAFEILVCYSRQVCKSQSFAHVLELLMLVCCSLL